jgi:fructose-specific phosphotransferase system IIA component
MLLLQDYIKEELILCDLKSQEKREVINELIEFLVKKKIIKNKDTFTETILKREELESTAIGKGIAIPHGRSEEVEKMLVIIAKTEEGIDFQSLDGKPVFVIFLIVAPKGVRKEYLQIVAKIARLAKNTSFREGIIHAKNAQEAMTIIKDFDVFLPEEIEVKTKDGRVIHRDF